MSLTNPDLQAIRNTDAALATCIRESNQSRPASNPQPGVLPLLLWRSLSNPDLQAIRN